MPQTRVHAWRAHGPHSPAIFLKREEECLAACTGAPMMMVDEVFHENLDPEKIDKVLDALK